MTIIVKELIAPKYAENTQTTQYTATNCKAIIDKFTVTNISGANATLSVNIVPSGGAASDANAILKTRTIAAGETYSCVSLVGHILESGSFISTLAGTASALTIMASGREIT